MKRILSIILVMVLIFSCVPVSYVHAENTTVGTPTISVESKYASPGTQVQVNVNITGNPGIAGAKITATFSDKLTLTEAVVGSTFAALDYTAPASLESGCAFNWDSLDAVVTEDGTLLTLTFTVSENAVSNEILNVGITYRSGDIYNGNLEDLEFEVVDGKITVIDYIPGDVNGDGVVNGKDVTLIRRYNAGFQVDINTAAADVNDDGVINGKDVTLIRRHNAGYNVQLKPSTPKCSHIMEYTPAKTPTCTEPGDVEYYYCTICGKYFNDSEGTVEIDPFGRVSALGHTAVTDPYVAPTYDSVGWTEGSHCAVCGAILVAQEQIAKLEKNSYSIVYNLSYNDSYLQSIEIENPNPDTYTTQDGLTLKEPEVDGYIFEGWYDGQGSTANKITQIPVGTTGEMKLYAHWSLVTYTINFNSPLTTEKDSKTYTVNTGATLTNPNWYGYNFVGWTDEEGNLVDRIAVGTAKNITLTANWTSKRNQTIPVSSLGDPLIIEEEDSNLILFVYELGRIENIPLFTIKDFGNSTGITWTEEVTISEEITNEHASQVAETIAEATTRSSSWTLSEGWNSSTEISQEYAHETSEEVQKNAKMAYEQNGQWTISKNSGGSSTVSNETGVSSKISSTLSSEVEVDSGIGVKAGVSAEVGSEIGADYTNTKENSKTWNTERGYSAGYSACGEYGVAHSVSESVSETYGYTQSYGSSSEWSQSNDIGLSEEKSREYGSSVVYATGTTTTTTRTYTNEGAVEGYYRLVAAGTAHVFGVVGYDLATKTYFSYTYTVMDEETKDFMDYSATTSAFDDQQNGVLPFDVPTEVNDYVDRRILETEGLSVDLDTGLITGYTGTATHVRIPTYMSVDSGEDINTVVKVTGISSTAFAGNTNIVEVTMPDTITEVPDSAFAGCTSLKNIVSDSITSIGSYAFLNCTALADFRVDTSVVSLGSQAFSGAGSVTIYAYNAQIAKSAAECGAKKVTLNMASMVDELSDHTFMIDADTEYVAFIGGTKSYEGVRIVSDAAETVINGMNLTGCDDTPLVISSEQVTLNRVNVTSTGLTMILSADTVNLALFSNNSMASSGSDAVRTNNIVLSQVNPSVSSKLNVTGNVLVCGTCTNDSYIEVTNGKIICYTLSDTCLVNFNANGGSCDVASKVVSCGDAIGELPEATYTGYVFYGWADADGNVITEDTVLYEAGEMTLYARWIEPYTITWEVGIGYTIEVTRTASPKGNAATGMLKAGDSIYPGDELTVAYIAAEGYSIDEMGETSITVTGNVTCAEIFAEASPNEYTYDIVYKSTGGIVLGTSEAKYCFGTTNTITAPSKSGYTTPDPQTVIWDSTTGKTITFVYTPIPTGDTSTSGTFYSSSPYIGYNTTMRYRYRTATTVQVQITTTVTIQSGWDGYVYGVAFDAACGSVGTGQVQVANLNGLNSGGKSCTATSGWMVIPLNTTEATTLSFKANMYNTNWQNQYVNSSDYAYRSYTWTMKIPAY